MNEFLGAHDESTAKAKLENFPVASRFLSKKVRTHLMAIYGFARLTDDIGDEAPGDRLALLDSLEAELERAAAGTASHPTMQRLTPVISDLHLDLESFRNLIDANRMDQKVTRYQTFDDLVAYCMLSAAPVGRLVLAVFDASTPDRIAWSDQICIGLQLVEHLQDVGEDAARDRVYLPLEDMERFHCSLDDLSAPSASEALRQVIAWEVNRARTLFDAGTPLASTLALRARVAIVGFVAGGMSALDAIEKAQHDVLMVRCRPSKLGVARRMARAFLVASSRRAA